MMKDGAEWYWRFGYLVRVKEGNKGGGVFGKL